MDIKEKLKEIKKDLEVLDRNDDMKQKGILGLRCWVMFQEDKINGLLKNIHIVENEMKEVTLGRETELYITLVKDEILKKKRELYYFI